MSQRRDHGWWPYLAPYGLFLLLGASLDRLPAGAALPGLLLKALAPAALVFWFARRGRLPELRGYRFAASDIGVGLLIAALWLAPYLVLPSLARGEAFDPAVAGESQRGLVLALRLLGFACVTPFVEELFVRSFLHRFLAVWNGRGDFRRVPLARFTRVGFSGTLAYFTLSHAPWEYWVALPTGALFNAWLYQRGHIGATIVAHATANFSIWCLVVFGPVPLWEFL